MAIQRLPVLPRRDTRRADSLVEIISLLSARRRELRASASERFRLLDERAAAATSRHLRLAQRMASIEGRLGQSDRLIQQLDRLRPSVDRRPANLRQLGSQRHVEGRRGWPLRVFVYLGGLLVLWVVLFQLGLALGLS